MPFDPRSLRDALGCFPTGVAVVTVTHSDQAPIGLTVNSFTSVSLNPPLVLWCVSRQSRLIETFLKAPGYTVSILGTAHQSVSIRLASPGAHRLEGIELLRTELGPPALADALAVFECAREATYEGGDHIILIGRILRFACRTASAPLVFFRGKYGALANITEVGARDDPR